MWHIALQQIVLGLNRKKWFTHNDSLNKCSDYICIRNRQQRPGVAMITPCAQFDPFRHDNTIDVVTV